MSKVNIDTDTLERIAHLSRLHLSEEDKPVMLESMNRIIGWMEQLNEVDTEGVEPLYHMTENENVMRADEVKGQFTQKEALKNAPKQDGEFFRVPKVVG